MAEQHTNKRQRYHKYKRGQFILVRFDNRLGTEFSKTHPAIVISKNDNFFRGDITVIPLTSKSNSQNLELGKILDENVYNELSKKFTQHLLSYDAVIEIIEAEKNSETVDVVAKIKNKIVELNPPDLLDDLIKLKQLSAKYEPMFKKSYAVVSQITTISKLKILKIVNDFDPLKELIVNDSILDKIDAEIINRFTRTV